MNELFKAYNSTNFDEALIYADDFSNQALATGDSVRIVQGGRMRAYALIYLGRNEEATEVLIHILGVAKRNQNKYGDLKGQIKFILNNIGLAYTYLGNYDKALEYHYQSLLIREEEGDKKSIRNALNNIGLVFHNLKDDERAIQNYLKALEISKELDDFAGQERLFANLGLSYNVLGKFDEAIRSFKKGFDLCGDKCDDNIMKEGLAGLGVAYKEKHELGIAKDSFLKSLEISRKQNDKRYASETLFELGNVEIELKNEAVGVKYIMEAEALAESIHLAEGKIKIYKALGEYYRTKKNYEKSLFYYNRYIQTKDSTYSDQLIKNLTKVQTNFDQRENLKTIAEKNQIVALQKEVITRTERQYFFIIAITCLIASLATVLYYFTRRQQRINKELSSAKNKIEEQNSKLAGYNKQLEEEVTDRTKDLNQSNKALRQVNEELDNFIYKTSHDIRGPLATLKGMCNVALMDVKDELAINYLKKLDVTADRMNTILTRLMIVNHINSSVLLPVNVNFREIIDEIFAFERKKGLPPRFLITSEIEPDSSIVSDAALVRIILENLIDNAIKFYNTSDRLNPYVKVKLTKQEGFVKVRVEDNGIGMKHRSGKDIFQMFMRASERSEIGGIGLYLAKIASEKIGGEVNLVNSDSKGSLFDVILPSDLNDVIKNRSKSEQNLIGMFEKESDSSSKSSSTII
ncbi:MAG TPA: tetratricopeptide repeat-containing sensor histidine kinase [Cyclobacteriaceae bacterium]|nr:tetratricopeptide repeat-containing sensor histidine kinase [Cyclobacteriaceae bacterium]